ncbi:MAG: toll/interleukin-1 receptor domain-containing protein [Gammaproteobacteria bacterium]|nr:toll/interleukin-1 receptor domain-containing protein [Gammaproteobacteria bacterium]
MSGSRTQILVSYSHADADWLKRLQVHLKPLERAGAIEWWDDTRILPGMVWRDEIEKALATAHIGVLLVSADFLASDFIANHELPLLLAAAQAKGLTILSLIVGPSQFQNTPELSRFQAVNDPTQPLIGSSKAEQETVLLKLAVLIQGLAGSAPPMLKTAPTTATATGFNPLAWLWDNRQWVFSGIGVTIGAAILAWVLSPSPPPKPATEIKAVGGVAAGGDIRGSTITIGSPDTPPKDNPSQER